MSIMTITMRIFILKFNMVATNCNFIITVLIGFFNIENIDLAIIIITQPKIFNVDTIFSYSGDFKEQKNQMWFGNWNARSALLAPTGYYGLPNTLC